MEKKPIATAKPIVGKPLGRPFLCPAVHRELTCRDVFPHPAPGANFSTAAQMSGITEESREDERNALASPTLRFAVVITGLVRSWAFCAQRLQSQLLDHSAPGKCGYEYVQNERRRVASRMIWHVSNNQILSWLAPDMYFSAYPLLMYLISKFMYPSCMALACVHLRFSGYIHPHGHQPIRCMPSACIELFSFDSVAPCCRRHALQGIPTCLLQRRRCRPHEQQWQRQVQRE